MDLVVIGGFEESMTFEHSMTFDVFLFQNYHFELCRAREGDVDLVVIDGFEEKEGERLRAGQAGGRRAVHLYGDDDN